MDESEENRNSTGKDGVKKRKSALDEDLGYTFFPERKNAFDNDEAEKKKVSFFWKAFKEQFYGTSRDRENCEKYVVWCVRNHPMVQIVMQALKSSGCPVDLRRHISCEKCFLGVNGGFDVKTNQVVLCENNVNQNFVCGVLAHELLHAFDKCRGKLDLNDHRHLACTEIRAAALTGCTYYSAWRHGNVSFNHFKNAHITCVKTQAAESVRAVRNISSEEAERIVNSVFDKCYNDLEPYGRVPQRKCRDMDKIISEASLLGYTKDAKD